MRLEKKGEKVPLYVTVYGKILERIKNNEVSPGDKLPGEVELANTLNVSRGTLRQALLLLQEDGIIYNRHGVGNFVSPKHEGLEGGLEETSIIPLNFSKESEVALINVSYQVASETIQEIFQMDMPKLVTLFNLKFTIEQEITSVMDVFIPYRIIDESNLSLNDKEVIKKFIIDYLNNNTETSKLDIRLVEAKKKTAERLEIDENTPILVFYEIMYSNSGIPIAYSKSYCIPMYFNFFVNRKK